MRKITSLLMLFCAFVGTAWAGPTDLPELTTDTDNPVWYTIKNTRSGKYMNYVGDAAQMTQTTTTSAATLFYFTAANVEATEGFTAVKIHTYKTTNLLSSHNSWTADGVVWYLHEDAKNTPATGLHITKEANLTGWNALNDAYQSHITDYYSNDAGSIFVVEQVTDFSSVIDVPAAKAAAIAEIQNYALVSTIYPATTSYEEAINAVTPENNSIAGLNAAIEAINAKVVDYKKAAYAALEGKYFSIQTLTTERAKGFMEMATSKVVGTETLASPAGLWQFVSNNDGTLKVFNPYTGKYLCEPQSNSTEIAVTTDANSAGNYTLEVNASATVAEAKIKLTSNGKSVHMAGGFTLVRWDNGGASEWQVKEVTDFTALIATYKTNTLETLDQWATLSVVFDAALINTAKANIDNITTTDFATFAAIDAELVNVADAVAAKMFTFQTKATDSGRNGVWVSADVNAGKAIGADNQDYNAIWSLRHAGGVSFYLYNELNSVYMGAPAGECALTAEPVAAYTFEIIDATNNLVEMKSNGGTLHASNWVGNQLINYDGDEDASRWYINTIDVTADIQAILNNLTADDYAEVPELGQYPTAAYNDLVEARNTAKTVEEVEAAIAAFKKSKNLPVFTIDGVISYAAGKSIYDDPGNVNAKGNTHYFKATNVYDKTMWWALDMTATEVGVIEEVGIYNVGTGNGFWGSSSIKITETGENEGTGIADDGIFLFYTTGNDSPIHYQNANQLITRYGDTGAASGSAHKFTYIGSTYELNQLTDEHIAALSDLQTAATAKAKYVNAEIGEGIGQYTGNKDAFLTAIANAQAIQAKSLVEVATMNIADITAVTSAITESASTFKLNMPTAGFYRVKSMNGNDDAKKGKYWQSKEDATGMELVAEKDAARSIIYLGEDNTLVSYGCGYALNQYDGMDAAGSEGKAWTISENTEVVGAYALYRNGDTYCLSDWSGLTYGQNDANAAWALEEVETLPVSVSAAGYATLYAPVALTIPAEVKVYTGTVNEDILTLNAVETTIPANTGVVLEAEEGEYNFAIGTDVAAIEGNALSGTIVTTAKPAEGEVFTLQAIDGIGFYPFTGENVSGFKAYLNLPAGSGVKGLRFGETTGIENAIVGENGNAAIFDLSGRRVAKMQKGIYIVNGKKVYVK
ncbi:MAG: hypothetical protein IJZ92_04845 [Bacteroidaceae bacterium]|nr:hypothetical protein [Bacteroidaceae bacterium]